MRTLVDRLESGMTYPEALASLVRVFKALLREMGYLGADEFSDVTAGNGWWRWLTSFLGYLKTDEGSFTPAQAALDARSSYVASLQLPPEHALHEPRYLDVFEACVRHLFYLAETDTRLRQDELSGMESLWPGWIRKRATKVLV